MIKIANQLWIEAGEVIDNEVIYTIGLTPDLQDEAGEISYASIADLGEIIEDETILNLEASKAAIEIPAPFNAVIIERNEAAETSTNLLDSDSKTDNWIVKVKSVDSTVFDQLENFKA